MACKTEKYLDKYPCDREANHPGDDHFHAKASSVRKGLFTYKTEIITWSTEEWQEAGVGAWKKTATHTYLVDVPKRDLFLGRF